MEKRVETTVINLLAQLRRDGHHLWHEAGKLKIRTAPTGLSAEYKQALQAHKAAILDFLQADNTPTQTSLDAIIPVLPVGQQPVLSLGQQRLWFLEQLQHNAAYNMPAALRLEGELNQAALERALAALLQRHQVLRYRIQTEAGKPSVQIMTPVPVKLSGLAVSEDELPRWLATAAARPFNLADEPLFRFDLLTLAEQRHVLVLNLHHIISDGIAVGILVREFAALYQAFVEGQPDPLPKLSIQYADYAAWQQQWLSGDYLQQQLTYWKQQLAGAPLLLELPTDYPRPAVQSYQGAHVKFTLPATLARQLRDVSQQQGCTVFMSLLAAFSVMLARYSGQTDVCVGSPVDTRNHPQTAGLAGFFANTLVLRTQFADNPSVSALLQQVRQTCVDAYAHQDVPFEQLVSDLKLSPSLSHAPLFQTMLVWQETAQESLSLPNLSTRWLEPDYPFAKFDLTLHVRERAGELECRWEYATSLFAADTIERMAERFGLLLHGMLANPQQTIQQLPWLTAAEVEALQAWNNTACTYPAHPLPVLFEQQVQAVPEQVAVVFGDQQLSYAQLNAQANQLAQHLRHGLAQQGFPSNALIAICAERSLEMVVALLAVLKAGAAYVPIDPHYPQERIAWMLEDTAAPLLLTQTRWLAHLPAHQAQVIDLNQAQAWADYSSSNPCYPVVATDLAYIIYTSGSTGKPKGVCLTHHSLSHYLYWARSYYAVAQGQGAPVQSSLSFDATITSLYLPLISGCTTYLIPEKQELEMLAEVVQRHANFSLLKITPSHLEALNQQLPTAILHDRTRALVLGGEALQARHLRPWLEHAPATRLVNEYGPTEATVGCVVYDAIGQQVLQGEVLIGKPIANARIYILDAYNQPLPAGISGELCIAGEGLAVGYLNRPELTAERFVTLELLGQYERVYKTGDRARWLADGNLQYQGRIDHQIKLRGFRIELGEIEACLNQHPQVSEAAVVLHTSHDNPRLLAYVSLETGTQTEDMAAVLKQYVQARLPDYMIPAHITLLDALPLTPNGKIDRKALEARDPCSSGLAQVNYIAPRNLTEQQLAEIWVELLGVERVGLYDHFFALGGHSLLTTQLAARIRDVFAVEIPLRTLFEQPVLLQQATWLAQAHPEQTLAPAIPVLQKNTAPVLSFAQQRLWFLARLDAESTAYHIPASLHLSGYLDVDALRRAGCELVQRQQSLRLYFPECNGEAGIGVLDAYDPLTVTDLTALSVAEQETTLTALTVAHAQQHFDLQGEPAFRLQLLQLSPTEQRLLINMHHIISDGWSMTVLIRELVELYRACLVGDAPQLEALPIQYLDYAYWQQHTGSIDSQGFVYWRQQLADAPARLTLPADFPRPSVLDHAGACVEAIFDADLTARLNTLAQQQGCTPFMVVLAAFNLLLHRYSGQDDVCIGTPVANRTRRETEQLVGLFVNTLVLRNRLQTEQRFSDLLQAARQTVLEAYAYQDVPFDLLVEQLNPARSLSHSPLFQVMLAWQALPEAALTLPGLTTRVLPPTQVLAKFDLTLYAHERDGQLHCLWEYAPALFAEATVQHMAAHLKVLLETVVNLPDISVSALLPDVSARAAQSLIAEADVSQQLAAAFVAPRTSTEMHLAGIWADLLGVRQISRLDNFFALGGHSLLAIKVTARVQESLGKTLPLRVIFEYPQLAALAAFLDNSVERCLPSIVPQAAGELAPLSFAQQRLWFLQQLEPASTAYHMPIALRLQGELNRLALQQTLQTLVERHAVLRSYFPLVEGSPCVQLAADAFPLQQHTLAGLNLADRNAALQAWMTETATRPFDLATGPLFRAVLLELDANLHVLLLNLHHIISDGWSETILIREFVALYTAFAQGLANPLTPLALQYSDYAAWQRQWLQGDVLAQQLGYWRGQLAGIPALLNLPTDHPRPAVQQFKGGYLPFSLSAKASKRLQTLSREQDATLFMTVLAAFSLLLARYSGQDDICIGSPVANRSHPQVEPLVGFFANTLVLRTRLQGVNDFLQLLRDTRQVCLDAYAHQDLPFEQLVEELQPARSLSHAPLFQALLVFQTQAEVDLVLPGLQVIPLANANHTTKFDLSLFLSLGEEGLSGGLEYNAELFEVDTIRQMGRHLEVLLTGIASKPGRSFQTLPVLTAAEEQQFKHWNATAQAAPAVQSLAAWVTQQAAQTPDAVAIQMGTQQWCYRELDTRSSQLAHALRQQYGVQPGALVGICMGRSPALMLGVLAILKAGAGYVPIDPHYPAERIRFMLDDAAVPVLLTTPEIQSHLPLATFTGTCLPVSADGSALAEYPTHAPDGLEGNVLPGYVIYTSGSTGQPKGVVMGQTALLNLIQWQCEQSGMGVGDKTLQYSPISFDVSFQEILSTWVTGGTLVLVAEEQRRDSRQLLHYLAEQGIQRLFLPFVALQQLADTAALMAYPLLSLQEVITAGEQLQITPAIAAWFQQMPDCRLSNHYGPSETHVVTAHQLPTDVAHWSALPPIGKPISNTQAFILDAWQSPVPVGVPGELWMGGVALAEGYLHRADLTGERFRELELFGQMRRVYRTGDQACWLPDGSLHYLGRLDGQVKIRGFRMELGEIETVLAQHPNVRECAVVVQGVTSDDKRLVACYVASNGSHQSVATTSLRQFLAEQLPDYMLPSRLIALDALPVTPSGKVDRRALEQLAMAEPVTVDNTCFVAPRTATETRLAALWAETLKLPQVSIHANFFELGGHSLLATRLLFQLSEGFGVDLPLRTLFETPTLAALAQQLDDILGAQECPDEAWEETTL